MEKKLPIGKILHYTIIGVFSIVVISVFGYRFYITKISDSGAPIIQQPNYSDDIFEDPEETVMERYDAELASRNDLPINEEDGKKIVNVKFSNIIKKPSDSGNTVEVFGDNKNIMSEVKKEVVEPSKHNDIKPKYYKSNRVSVKESEATIKNDIIENKEEYDPFETILTAPTEQSNQPLTETRLKGRKFKAEIFGEQDISEDNMVIVRVLEDFKFGDIDIHYNSRLSGKASFSGSRYFINLSSAKTSQGEFPIDMKVLDNDGYDGLFYKSGVEKNLEGNADEQIDDYFEGSRSRTGELIGEGVKDIYSSVVKENRKPLKKKDYPIYVVIN